MASRNLTTAQIVTLLTEAPRRLAALTATLTPEQARAAPPPGRVVRHVNQIARLATP